MARVTLFSRVRKKATDVCFTEKFIHRTFRTPHEFLRSGTVSFILFLRPSIAMSAVVRRIVF
jgi:hypothetical protein